MAPTQVTEGLFIVPVGAVNTYLLDAPEGFTLVDAGFPDKVDVILAAIRAIGRAPGDLKHIVLTHAHPDHIGSLAAVQRATGAQSTIHVLDASIVESGGPFRPMSPAPGLLPALLMRLFSRPGAMVEPARIDRQVQGGEVLPLAGGIEVIHTPGHCAGHVALLWRSRGVLFAGDACANLFGLGPPIGYEDRAVGERSQRTLCDLPFDIACFGHGKPILRDASARFRKRWG